MIVAPQYLLECIPLCEENRPWSGPGVPGDVSNASVWTSFLCDEIEAFTSHFCRDYVRLTQAPWNCLMLPGHDGFQDYASIGCMRLLQEHGASVKAWLRPVDSGLLQRYKAILDNFGIEIEVLGDQVPDTKLSTFVIPCRKPAFSKYGRGYQQHNCSLPHWFDWEAGSPHALIQASVSGFPLYGTPATILMLEELIDFWRPKVVLDVYALKFGFTAALVRSTFWLGSKVIAVNPPGLEDAEWFDELVSRPWAGNRCSLVHGSSLSLGSGESILAFVNVHAYETIEAVTCAVRQSYKHGVFVFHATQHGDMPRFLKGIHDDPTMIPIEYGCYPQGGTWCEGGLFEFTGT